MRKDVERTCEQAVWTRLSRCFTFLLCLIVLHILIIIITSFQPPRADEMILPIDGIGGKLQAPRTNRAAQILSGCHQRRTMSADEDCETIEADHKDGAPTCECR
jgi:hypothetical protein